MPAQQPRPPQGGPKHPGGPPRHGGTSPGKPGKGKQPPKVSVETRRKQIYNRAVGQLRNALIDKGLDPNSALRFAQVALAKAQGASIGPRGQIHLKGQVYNAKDFANTPLIDFITGAKAKAANQKVLLADPTYQQNLAQLGLSRDQSLADLEAQRRSALIDFGDASFVQGDPVLAAAIRANKDFSTSALLNQAYQRQQNQVQQAAGAAGTVFGGGLQSGLGEARRVYAGNEADATRTLVDLLSNINMQRANLGQNYDLGQRGALLQAQQALTAAGVLQPATPPALKKGPFKWWTPPHPPAGGGPRPPRPPRGVGTGGGGRTDTGPGQPLPPHPPRFRRPRRPRGF